MSLLDSLKSVFAGKPSVGGREGGGSFLVDAEKLAESREGQGRLGPVERFQAIQQLSRLAEREKVEVVAVVGGRPLREVAHGEAFNGVKVFYVEAEGTLADQMLKVLGGEMRGRRPVVITNDKQLDAKLASQGVATMRVSTLRKAFENGGGEGGGNGGDRQQQRRQRRGPRPDRGDRGDRGDRPERQDRPAPQDQQGREPESRGERPAPEESSSRSSDTIDNLIDRVD